MIVELVVTSAPRGLQAGRSGFTTVMRTRGIHPDLAARLEAASGYRHVYPQGDPRNPVIYCYAMRTSAVRETWVMSRIGDAGTDYSGRSNKIAHHVALQAADLAGVAASSPAMVMTALVASGGMLTRWAGEPRENSAAPTLPLPPVTPGICQRWAAASGDAGWAGVLVERALNREATWVIAPPGIDLLALYAEALTLVSPAQRWQIPFTTYSLRGDEGRWLGTTVGSPEASAAAGQTRVMVIDLTRRGPTTLTGPYVQAARGEATVPWQRQAARPGRQPVPASGDGASGGDGLTSPTLLPGMPGAAGLSPITRPPRRPRAHDDEWEDVPIDRPVSGRLALLVTLAVVAVVLVAGGGGAGLYGFNPRFRKFVDERLGWGVGRDVALHEGRDGGGDPDAGRATDDQERGASTPADKRPRDKPPPMGTPAESATPVDSGVQPEASIPAAREPDREPDPVAAPAPSPEVKPEPTFVWPVKAAGSIPSFDPAAPAAIVLASWEKPAGPEQLREVDLALPSLEDMPPAFQLVLSNRTDNAEADEPTITWQCGTRQRPDGVGTFTLTGTALSFAYAEKPAEAHSLLPLMPVRMTQRGSAAHDLTIQPASREIGEAEIRDDVSEMPLPGVGPIPEGVCAALSRRLRLLDATLGLAISADVPLVVAAADERPRFAATASFATAEGGGVAVWWRPEAEGSRKDLEVREPITVIYGLKVPPDTDTERDGPEFVMRPSARVTDPMPKVLRKVGTPGFLAYLKSITDDVQPTVGPDAFVGWLALYVHGAKKPDDPPFGDLRNHLRSLLPPERNFDGLVDEIGAYLKSRDCYRSHVRAKVQAELDAAYPDGVPAAPGPEPSPAKPGDAADQQRYADEKEAWDAKRKASAECQTKRLEIEERIRGDAGDFRRWVEDLVARERVAEGDGDDREVAELWRTLHVYAVLRRGGLPLPTKDAAPVFLHVSRFKGLAQLRWEFPGVDEPAYTTLAEIDFARRDTGEPGADPRRPRAVMPQAAVSREIHSGTSGVRVDDAPMVTRVP